MDKKIALNKLMNTCSRQEKCSFDILKKLSDWEFSDKESKEILNKLISGKYINNKRYSIAFANDKIKFSHWGKIKVTYVLRQKNINQEFIDFALAQINTNKYFKIIKDEIQKKDKSIKTTNQYQKRAKLLRFGQSRGYELEILNKILAET